MDPILRKLNEMALQYGEKHLSPQTGYVHLRYHSLEEEEQHTIPLVENFLFALALFQARTVESALNGKSFLEKLLYFQQEEGNFPLYLHEYPKGSDYYTAVKLLAPIYWILHDFSSLLGADLKLRLEACLKKLLNYSLGLMQEKKPPFMISLQIAAASLAAGQFFRDAEMEKKGGLLLNAFKSLPKEAFSTESLGPLMGASQMVSEDFNRLFPGFFNHLLNTWSVNLSAYIGPALFEEREGFEPKAHLYDLYMGYLTGHFSKRAEKPAAFHLHAALIREMPKKERQPKVLGPYRGEVEAKAFFTSEEPDYSFSYLEQLEELHPSKDRGFSAFRLNFGTKERLHTLSIEGGHCQKISGSKNRDYFEFFFHLGALPELEEREKPREVAFYLDLTKDMSFLVDGIKANVFQLNDHVMLNAGGKQFQFKFELVEGEGQFLGHFMRGNRPSQVGNKGKERFSAFDAQIFLRTLRRSTPTVIKTTLFIK